jgi:hypothetical protein
MSYQATAWALYQDTKNPTLKALLQTLCHHADSETWECFPSMVTIARETCISKRTVQRRLQELADMGFIEIVSQRGEMGRQGNNLYRITGGQSVTLEPPGGQNQLPGGQNEQSRVTLVSTNNEIGLIGRNNTRAKKRSGVNDQIEYSEEFEIKVWQSYPRREGSKKKAYDYWNMLNDENRARVIAAIPVFAAQMKREGRPSEKIPHLTTWFNGRDYETVAPSASTTPSTAKPFWETATRKQWGDALVQWSYNWNWKKMWGPEPEDPLRPNPPGSPKCCVPQDILDRFDLKYRGHLYSPEQKQEIRERVEQASKHAVDNGRAPCDTRATEQPHTSR